MSASILRLDVRPRNACTTASIPAPFQLPQQSPHVPLGDTQFLSGLLLRDQFLLGLFQGHQPVPLGLRHQ